MKKRLVNLLLATVMTVGTVSLGAVPVAAHPESKEVTVKSFIFTNTDSTMDLTVPFDFDWLIENDNTVYNSELAAFSAIASTDAYYREKDEGTAAENKVLIQDSGEAYDCTSFLSAFGFEDVCRIETYDKKSTDIDKNDSATFLAGHRLIDGKDVFAFVFRGAYSSGEWLSAFDLGDPSKIGDHPNWTDPDHLKSIDVAANAAMSKINDYIKEFGKEDAPDSILLTGHSRGGAIANVLGAKLEKAGKLQSYTYTFSSPKTTLAADASSYKTVFNINNSDDFFEDFLPFRSESYSRYGVDLKESFTNNTKLKNQLKKFGAAGDYACMTAQEQERYNILFGSYFNNRTALYQTTTETLTFDHAADAQSKYDACVTVIDGFKLNDLCSVKLDGNKVYLTTAKASLLQSYSMVLAYGTPDMVDYVKTFFPQDEIADLLYRNLTDLNNAHRILKSYVLCGAVNPTEPQTEKEVQPSKSAETKTDVKKSPATGDRFSWICFIFAVCLISCGASFFSVIRLRNSTMGICSKNQIL